MFKSCIHRMYLLMRLIVNDMHHWINLFMYTYIMVFITKVWLSNFLRYLESFSLTRKEKLFYNTTINTYALKYIHLAFKEITIPTKKYFFAKSHYNIDKGKIIMLKPVYRS